MRMPHRGGPGPGLRNGALGKSCTN